MYHYYTYIHTYSAVGIIGLITIKNISLLVHHPYIRYSVVDPPAKLHKSVLNNNIKHETMILLLLYHFVELIAKKKKLASFMDHKIMMKNRAWITSCLLPLPLLCYKLKHKRIKERKIERERERQTNKKVSSLICQSTRSTIAYHFFLLLIHMRTKTIHPFPRQSKPQSYPLRKYVAYNQKRQTRTERIKNHSKNIKRWIRTIV